jgi:hypothetical protein
MSACRRETDTETGDASRAVRYIADRRGARRGREPSREARARAQPGRQAYGFIYARSRPGAGPHSSLVSHALALAVVCLCGVWTYGAVTNVSKFVLPTREFLHGFSLYKRLRKSTCTRACSPRAAAPTSTRTCTRAATMPRPPALSLCGWCASVQLQDAKITRVPKLPWHHRAPAIHRLPWPSARMFQSERDCPTPSHSSA